MVEKNGAGRHYLLAANAAAVIIAAVMIILSRAGQQPEAFHAPPPPVAAPAVAPGPAIAGTSPSATPAPVTSSPVPDQVATVPAEAATPAPAPAPGTAPPPWPPADGTSLGSPDAPITIQVFSDFQCGICQAFALGTGRQLEETYVKDGTVRLVFKHFVVFDEESVQAAAASEAAAEQNRFWEYSALLWAFRASPRAEDLTIPRLQGLAEEAGLDMEAFNASFLSGKHRDKIAKDFQEAKDLEAQGTPTFFINGIKAQGNLPITYFQELIEWLLAGGAG